MCATASHGPIPCGTGQRFAPAACCILYRMATRATEVLMTADEFDRLPQPPEGGKLELVDGEVIQMMTVSPEHGELQVSISTQLDAFARQHRLGKVYVETGFRLGRGRGMTDVRGPDVSFVRAEKLPPRAERRSGSFRFAPDLAVEVISPEDLDTDVAKKVEDYLAAGTARVWVVRPDTQTITVHRPAGEAHVYHQADTLGSDDASFDAAGFELNVGGLFDDALEG